MHFWHSAPLIRILFPCLAAIFCGIYLPLTAEYCLWLCIASLLSLLLISCFLRKPQYSLRWLHGSCLQLLVFGIFCWLTVNHNELRHPQHFSRYPHQGALILRISSDVERKARSWKCFARVESVIRNDTAVPVQGTVLLYLKTDSMQTPAWGDRILSDCRVLEIKAPANPGEFNYKQYLAFRNVHYQVFLERDQCIMLEADPPGFPVSVSNDIRDYFITVFRNYIPGEAELGVAEALIFGYKADLDPETVQAYSNTGTLHVLAVSGLHVGIVFLVLAQLLKFMDREKRLRIFKSLIIICFLWIYALVTGFSPSVVRASLMFSLIIFGKIINRSANIYNSVAASAFLLLAVNPYYLMDVGFQLSYMAVIGIIYLQPLLLPLWEAPNNFLHAAWSLTAVSIAAQISTLPLSLYYFHQFPVYFLLSNLVIIPLSNIVVYLGLIMLALSFSPMLAGFCGKLMSLLLNLTNSIVSAIEQFPGALIDNISFDLLQMLLLITFSVLFLSWIATKHKAFLFASLGTIVMITASGTNAFIQNSGKERLLIYHLPGHSVVEYQRGSQALLCGVTIQTDPARQKFHLANGWLLRGVKEKSWDLMPVKSMHTGIHYFALGTHTLLIADSGLNAYTLRESPVKVDYLLLQHKPKVRLSTLFKNLRPATIIADGSNPQYRVKHWKAEADSLGVSFYSTAEGAFVVDLK